MLTSLVLIFWCLVLLVMIILGLLWLYGMFAVKAPFVPLPAAILATLVNMIKLQPGDVLYDLGSGDGRILLSLAKNHPQTKFVGIEKGPIPFLISKANWLFKGRPANVKFVRGDFFRQDLKPASHIFTYLFPEVMVKLLPKMEQELCPGTQLFSCDFQFTKKEPLEVTNLGRHPHQLGQNIYRYQF